MEHQWTADMRHFCSVFVLLITAVSVSSAQAVELNLRVGDTVTFTTEVRNNGGLTYSGSTIGDVSGGRFTPLPSEQYKGRVQWDSSTGLFSITGLKMEDSGRYRVKNDANLDTVYQLTVFTNVSSPLLTLTHDKYPCTLLCTVDRGTQVTLSLYREGEGERYVNYPPVNAPHHLPQTVDRSGTYTCEAKNSVSKKMTSITVGDHCTEGSTGPNAGLIAGLGLLVLACVGVLVGVIAYLYRHQSKSIKDQKSNTQALTAKVEEQNKCIADLEKSKKDLETNLRAEIRKQREEQNKLTQEQKESIEANLKKQREALTERIADLEKSKKDLEKSLGEQNECIAGLEKSKKELETNLSTEIRKQREEQTKLAEALTERIADLEKSKKELEKSLGGLKESENRQNQRIQALVQSKTNLEKSLGALEKSKNALTERIADLEKSKKELEKSLGGLEKSKKELEKSPRALKESENALTAKVEGKQ